MFKQEMLEYHSYFMTSVIKRRTYLTEKMICVAIKNGQRFVQENQRISYTFYLLDEKKFLRVITEKIDDKEIVFNAYFDRTLLKKGI
jgi:hypothetical protein